MFELINLVGLRSSLEVVEYNSGCDSEESFREDSLRLKKHAEYWYPHGLGVQLE